MASPLSSPTPPPTITNCAICFSRRRGKAPPTCNVGIHISSRSKQGQWQTHRGVCRSVKCGINYTSLEKNTLSVARFCFMFTDVNMFHTKIIVNKADVSCPFVLWFQYLSVPSLILPRCNPDLALREKTLWSQKNWWAILILVREEDVEKIYIAHIPFLLRNELKSVWDTCVL